MKTCNKCHTSKSESDFYSYIRLTCKDCIRKRERIKHHKNKDNINANRKKRHIKNLYDLTLEEYNAMWQNQSNSCSICKKQMTKKCLDHNHKTGHLRAFLCNNCNVLLGMANEDITILQSAIDYIKRKGQP